MILTLGARKIIWIKWHRVLFLGYSLMLIKCSKGVCSFSIRQKNVSLQQPWLQDYQFGMMYHSGQRGPCNSHLIFHPSPFFNKPFFLNIGQSSVVVWLFSVIPISDNTESHFYVISGFLRKKLLFSYFPVSPRLFIAPKTGQLPIPPRPWHSKRFNVYLDSVNVTK